MLKKKKKLSNDINFQLEETEVTKIYFKKYKKLETFFSFSPSILFIIPQKWIFRWYKFCLRIIKVRQRFNETFDTCVILTTKCYKKLFYALFSMDCNVTEEFNDLLFLKRIIKWKRDLCGFHNFLVWNRCIKSAFFYIIFVQNASMKYIYSRVLRR